MTISSVNSLHTQIYNNTGVQNHSTHPSFRATQELQADTVEISTKTEPQKKKRSWLANAAIFSGAAIGSIALLGLGLHGIGSHINKLYKNKLVMSNLPEKLEFKEAKTLDEAINFSKEVLKIKEVDSEFTLDALNIANKGLIDVSNAHKGKVFMPPALKFKAMSGENENYIAYVISDIESKEFGNMFINRNYFEDKFLTGRLDKMLHFENGDRCFEINLKRNQIDSYHIMGAYVTKPTRQLAELIEKYYKNPSKMTMQEKQKLYYSMSVNNDASTIGSRNPLDTLKEIYSKNKKFIKSNNISINIDEISNKSIEEQKKCLMDLVKKLEDNGRYSYRKYDVVEPTRTVHHEAGHLQDFAENLKKLDTQKWNQSFKEWSRLYDLDKKQGTNLRRRGVDEVENRWGSIKHKEYKELFETNPEKFKQKFPEWYEFLTDKEIQNTAGKVSSYAKVGIGEFIAEVYAELIAGKKLPEDVMALYRKYNGPKIP